LNEAGHIEVYDSGRYFVLTGAVYNEHDDVIAAPLWVTSVQRDVFPTKERFTFRVVENAARDSGTEVVPQQVYQTIRAYVKSHKHDVD
jgi:hypothetical protein